MLNYNTYVKEKSLYNTPPVFAMYTVGLVLKWLKANGGLVAMAEHNSSQPEREPIEFRIGVNLGEIVIEGKDIFGDGVNVAARLETQAPKAGILVSDAVHCQIKGKVGVEFVNAGELMLKNIAAPVQAWRWGGNSAQIAQTPTPAKGAKDAPSIAVLPFNQDVG